MLLQPLSWLEHAEAFKAHLYVMCNLVNSQAPQELFEWLDNMEEQFKSGTQCTKDNLRHANCCTCLKMNEKDHRRHPLPRNVIGYTTTSK